MTGETSSHASAGTGEPLSSQSLYGRSPRLSRSLLVAKDRVACPFRHVAPVRKRQGHLRHPDEGNDDRCANIVIFLRKAF